MPKNLSRIMPARSIERFYTAIHANMQKRESAGGDVRPTIAEFQSVLRSKVKCEGVALDAGCGGTAAASVACAEHGFGSVQGIDLNLESLLLARVNLRHRQLDAVHLLCGSLLCLPLAENSVDFAVCGGVIHHTPEPEQALGELARVIRAGGRLYLSVYCFSNSLFEAAVRLMRWFGARIPFSGAHRILGENRIWNNFVMDHMYVPVLWLFRAEEVRQLLTRHGFAILAEWPSAMDPFSRWGSMGKLVSGDGLLRVWLCQKM